MRTSDLRDALDLRELELHPVSLLRVHFSLIRDEGEPVRDLFVYGTLHFGSPLPKQIVERDPSEVLDVVHRVLVRKVPAK